MGDVLSFVKDTITDVIDIVTYPAKVLLGTVSSTAQDTINQISDVVEDTGITDFANNAINSIGGAAGSVLNTGENLVNRGSDSLFGTIDVLKYIPYVALGFLGIFGLKYGSEIIAEAGSASRVTRGVR